MMSFFSDIMQRGVSDVVVTGYIDSEVYPVFHPMYDRIYFIVGEDIFEIYIDDGVIYCNKLKCIDEWFEVDEDDKFSLMSIYSQLFKTEQEIKITKVDYKSTAFAIISINYKDGDNERQLLLDPNNLFGFAFL